MENKISYAHNGESVLYYLSRFLERLSYYGIRSLLVLYMINSTLNIEQGEAFKMYGTIIFLLSGSQFIGGLVGDFVLGNRKSIILGGILQALGAFILCVPSMSGFYMGLFFLILGSGLFSPNILANFGKSFLNKIKSIDSGFTLFYVIVGIAATLGIMLIGGIGEHVSWQMGFMTAGILSGLSVIPILFIKKDALNIERPPSGPLNNRILSIAFGLILISIFWTLYEIAGSNMVFVQRELGKASSWDLLSLSWISITTLILSLIGVVASILWIYVYTSQYFKLAIGFIFGALFFAVLNYLSQPALEPDIWLYVASLGLLSISEILIAPTIYSIITKHFNPKYLATFVSLMFIPTQLCSALYARFGMFDDETYSEGFSPMIISIITMGIISLVLIIFLIVRNKNKMNYNE